MKINSLITKYFFLFLIFFLQFFPIFAQASKVVPDNGMANLMYESGKIYVVIGVILLIFIGVVFYLIALDRRIKKMEDEI